MPAKDNVNCGSLQAADPVWQVFIQPLNKQRNPTQILLV